MTYQRQTLSLFSQTPDLIPQDAPQEAWNDAENIQFRNGESMRVYGDHPTLPGATGPIRAMVFCEPQGQEFWVYCTASGIYAHDGTTEYDVTPTWWIESDPDAVYTACEQYQASFTCLCDITSVSTLSFRSCAQFAREQWALSSGFGFCI